MKLNQDERFQLKKVPHDQEVSRYIFIVFLTTLLCSCGATQDRLDSKEIMLSEGVDSSVSSPESTIRTDTIRKSSVTNKKIITEAKELFKQITNKKIKVLFHGFGTEPFWDLYITRDEVLYTVNEEYTSYELITPFDKNKRIQKILYKDAQGKMFDVTIKNEPAGDGMSDMTYPYSVIFSEDQPYLNGAGDIK